MHRFRVLLRAAALVLLGTPLVAHLPAAAQNPVPLPTDTNLAAYVSVTGSYRNINNQQRNLTMASWLSAYLTGETINFATMTDRAFIELGLPSDTGWGYMVPDAETVAVSVRVTDVSNRLGHVLVQDHATGIVVADLPADAAHHDVTGSFAGDSEVTEYVLTVLSTSGSTLARMAADVGKVASVVPLVFVGGFQPFTPEPISCTHFSAVGQYSGTLGNPLQAPGVQSSLSPVPGYLESRGYSHDSPNDSPVSGAVRPPLAWRSYLKRTPITFFDREKFPKIEDQAALLALQSALTAAQATDLQPALSNLDVPPYSDSCGSWQLRLQGQVTSVLVAPYERKRKGGLVSVLMTGIASRFSPGEGFLSALLNAAATTYLADVVQNQSSFKPGDVMVWGDIYALVGSEASKTTPRQEGITTPVTFTLAPNIAPPAGMDAIGSGSITDWAATTTPPPPAMALNATLSFSPYNAVVTKALPKGYQYKANGNITFPVGYQGGTLGFFTVPGSSAVTIPCTLTKLLTWRIVTVTQSPAPPLPPAPEGAAYVVVKSAAGVPVLDGYSAFVNGHYVCTFLTLEPGAYTVEATRTMVGAPPATYKGSVTVPLSIGAEREDTVTLTRQ